MNTNWKNIYQEVLKNFCSLSSDNVIAYVNLGEPSFVDKLIPNEDISIDAMYRLKLDDTKATEKDYKDFCYYVFASNGYDFDDYFQGNKGENEKMEKIRKLLKEYGASEEEINNFITDLENTKEKIDNIEKSEDTDNEEFNYLDKETMDKLKSSEKGKDLILKAPTMERKALRKAIQDFLKE